MIQVISKIIPTITKPWGMSRGAILLLLCSVSSSFDVHANEVTDTSLSPQAKITEHEQQQPHSPLKECVILLHGLARSASSMEYMAERLTQHGYSVANIDYPSREHAIAVLAPLAIDQGVKQCAAQQATTIHFVTHSLGGILVRHYLAHQSLPNLGRVVMLGPPNKGSEVVDALRDTPGFFWLNGPAGLELGTDANSVPNTLGPANFEVGIITGTWSIDPISSWIIPDQDDGKVSVIRAHLDNEQAFLVLPVTHTFIMQRDRVIDQVLAFLTTGAFLPVAE